MIELKIIFGTDQKIAIDNLLKHLIVDGLVIKFDSEVKEDHAHYIIEFASAYGIYFFGHETGLNLLNYLY